ncbi:PIG-L deacetylase family protein [Candidatus Pseudomonas adelgestsugas]|uniref:GlcNAc-PI de-N-acetylase n=1 Tax=Candidatus Pseudomonas adelgestsugas TaxID=1302376 RepID=A0ABX5R883_9PSED|nr:PIG-L family deacetylase [Candidatus Pseudomonas adelgestsugas]QAX81569.1 GlcNAc-PI de-N-acetylase [Candidatus Pseudomonas adelgestsugas]
MSELINRKQILLKRYRRNKCMGLLVSLLILICVGLLVVWWLPILLAVFTWLVHENWFVEYLFYSPKNDYQYKFTADTEQLGVTLDKGRLVLRQEFELIGDETLILAVRLKSSMVGHFIDPYVVLSYDDRQVFERGVNGLRYLNLTGQAQLLLSGQLLLRSRFCHVQGELVLSVFRYPDVRRQRMMVIAPHADDAELAAFGLYSQTVQPWIVTLTAGEIEAEHYQRMGLSKPEAARLKGRLRAWDSIVVPRWAGIRQEYLIQLGYFCLQLMAMKLEPDRAVVSLEAELNDIRVFRQFNQFLLPADTNGLATWSNLLADLRAIILLARPEVIVLPCSLLDSHPDHVCARQAVLEALQDLEWQPTILLGYANHLHDNNRWPMGDSGNGVALPPFFDTTYTLLPYCVSLSKQEQCNKAMSLGMMHDLQPRISFKRRVRRVIQRLFSGRAISPWGENDFFRKAVRRHELFWFVKYK